jgi:hypothetical protein
LTRAVIVSILADENVSDAELEAHLKKRLDSKLFLVERMAILDDQRAETVFSFIRKLK